MSCYVPSPVVVLSPAVTDERYNDVNFWRMEIPLIMEDSTVAATAKRATGTAASTPESKK